MTDRPTPAAVYVCPACSAVEAPGIEVHVSLYGDAAQQAAERREHERSPQHRRALAASGDDMTPRGVLTGALGFDVPDSRDLAAHGRVEEFRLRRSAATRRTMAQRAEAQGDAAATERLWALASADEAAADAVERAATEAVTT